MGNGLYCPVAGSGSETTLGTKRLLRILLLLVLWTALWEFCDGVSDGVSDGCAQGGCPRFNEAHTQLRLKQSCEQKKLSVPIFRQVGHCRDPASLAQSTPIHFRVSAAAMANALITKRGRGESAMGRVRQGAA